MALTLLQVEDANGNVVNLRVNRIIAVDGKPLTSVPEADQGLLPRIVLLEAHVADLIEFRKVLLTEPPGPPPSPS